MNSAHIVHHVTKKNIYSPEKWSEKGGDNGWIDDETQNTSLGEEAFSGGRGKLLVRGRFAKICLNVGDSLGARTLVREGLVVWESRKGKREPGGFYAYKGVPSILEDTVWCQ